MKARHLALVLGAAAVVSTETAEHWRAKPFNTWTDAELKEVLTSSPWAGRADITYVQTPGLGFVPIRAVAQISWSSALPLRQASEREKSTAGAAVPPEAHARLAAEPDAYVIRVLVTRGVRPYEFATQAALTRAATSLLRTGRPALRPSQVDGLILDRDGKVFTTTPGGPSGAASLFVITFPKTDPITLGETDVEFVTKLCTASASVITDLDRDADAPLPPQCNLNVRKKFKLKEMIYNGSLAL